MDNNDITQIILNTINNIIDNLLASIDNNLYSLLDNLAFVDSNILNDNSFFNILGTSTTNGILLISNSLLLGILIYYSILYLLSHITYSQIEDPSSFIIKLILCGICMNSSFFLLTYFIDFISFISSAILEIGENLYNTKISFSELILNINNNIAIDTSSLNFFSFDGILKTLISFSLLNLILSYSFRYILIKIFILITPFAILLNSLKSTSWFFKSWFKTLFSLLFIQIIISLVLLILFSINYSLNLFSKFIYIGGIYCLIKSNSLVKEFIGGISTDISQNVYKLTNTLR